ncbi:MAG TPA: hydrogen peroxide-inducible genes activator [Nevskiaceae bacterium]|nr:hydrogen peroxide-inducible genes activator [Nevskiaceae bacterium]
MTLTELRYLVNLDRERHFGRAADRSFVSQPTLSVAIKKLEDQLGVALFERSRGEVKPTAVGERIIVQARKVIAEAKRVEDLAREGRDELAGALRFGAIYTVAPYLLPHLIPRLREQAPQMPLVLEENFTARLLEQLREDEIDVICVALPIQTPGLSTWALYDEDFVVVLPSEHRWASAPQIAAGDLAEESLLLLGPGHCFRDQVISACPKCVEGDGETARPRTGSSLETIRHMVAGGLGVTVLPQAVVENRGDDSGLTVWRPFRAPAPSRRIALVWRKSFPRLKAVAALRQAILSSPLRGVSLLFGEALQEGL